MCRGGGADSRVGLHECDDGGDSHVGQRANGQGGDDADGHIAGGVLCFLCAQRSSRCDSAGVVWRGDATLTCGSCNDIETDVGVETRGCTLEYAQCSELRRNKRVPVLGLHVE